MEQIKIVILFKWRRRPHLSVSLITRRVSSCRWDLCPSYCLSCRQCLGQTRRRSIRTSIFLLRVLCRSPFQGHLDIILECFVIRDGQHIVTIFICTYSSRTRPVRYRHMIKNIRLLWPIKFCNAPFSSTIALTFEEINKEVRCSNPLEEVSLVYGSDK
jgi:hypothetical protein